MALTAVSVAARDRLHSVEGKTGCEIGDRSDKAIESRRPADRTRSCAIGSGAPSGPVNEGTPAPVASSLTLTHDVPTLWLVFMDYMDNIKRARSGQGAHFCRQTSILPYGDGNVSMAVSEARGGRGWASRASK